MHIILSRNPHEITSFNDWVGDVLNEVTVITRKEHVATYSPFFKVVGLHNYDCIDEKINAIRSVMDGNNFEINSIAAVSEFDLEEAAKCRQIFGVGGQSLLSAKAFRNKLLMKKFVADAGIPIATYECARSLDKVKEFGETHGFPIIVKPIDGGGSANTFKLTNSNEVVEKLSSNKTHIYLCEVFIDGGMIHCDGLFEDGELKLLSISEYIGSCLSYQVGGALASYQLDEDSQKWKTSETMLKKVLAALPCPRVMGFHAEFFIQEDGKLVFCEIASRLGGVRVIDTIEASHKTSMIEYWVRSQLNLPNLTIGKCSKDDIWGWVSIPPKEGILTHIPDSHPFDWVRDYKTHYSASTTTKNAGTSVDSVVSYMVTANSMQEIKERIDESVKWFTDNIKY